MNRFLTLMLTAFALAACGTIDAYTPAPKTCEGVEAERTAITKKLKIESQAATARKIVMTGGAFMASPILIIAAPFVWSLDINTTGERKRRDLLWIAADRMGCG